MKPVKEYEWILKEARKYPGSDVYFKEAWGVFCFFVEKKLFGYLGDHEEKGWIVTFKGRLEHNLELREEYSFIEPGYHMNKLYWNTVLVDHSEVNPEIVKKLLESSYKLVFSGLPKKIQAQIKEK